MTNLTDIQLRSLARLGAIARLKELDDEAAAIRKAFPGLKKAGEPVAETAPTATPSSKARKSKGRMMSAEARKLQSEKMKAYWAKKRDEATATEGKRTKKSV
jgi:hypothetical protein